MCIGKGTKVVGMEGSDRCFKTFVHPGRVKIVSSRSPRWNHRSKKFWMQDVFDETSGMRVR
jgi:hypothetical protein